MPIIKLQGLDELQRGVYYEYDPDLAPLGEGAMGRVYQGFCVDVRTKSKFPVAIKAIFENIPSRVIERARREASVRIDSPFLLKMYGFVEMPFVSIVNEQKIHITRYYVVMELLTGVTLYDLMQGSFTNRNGEVIPAIKSMHDALTVNKYETIRAIMVKVLKGVKALHESNYIHRDIDPSNIMITSIGQIKLIDFGICKPINSLGTADKNLTSTGVFMGKVNYAAPELVIGDVLHQGPATDLYALGILLFQLCTGHLPFSGDDNDVLLAHMRKPIPLKEIENRWMRKVIDKATQKVQAKRYHCADQMLHELENINFSNNKSKRHLQIISVFVAISFVIGAICLVPSLTNNITDRKQFESIRKGLWSENDSIANDAFRQLEKMAYESHYKDAMFELGLTYSVENSHFDIPMHRQKKLHLQPNIEIANKWLLNSYDADKSNYRAVYWIINNLIYQKQQDESSVSIDEIWKLMEQFDKITKNLDDDVATIYKQDFLKMRQELKRWE